MFTTTIKNLVAHKRRMVTTALAVMLGVAFMAGTLVLTDTIGKTFDNLFADVYRNTDAVVRAEAAFEGPQNSGTQRGRVDAALVATVAGAKGVAVAEGTSFGYARLVGKDGKAIGNPMMGAPTLGGQWSVNSAINPFHLVAGGPPRADDEVVIDRKSARDGKLSVGDVTTVLVQGPPQQVKIVGIARFGNADSPGGASFVMFLPPVAQRLIGEPGKFDAISLIAEKGVSQGELIGNVRPALPADVEVVTGAAITKETQNDARDAMSFFSTFMTVFALVALVVGGFMIFNTFSITVAQRTRENGLLRALGASRRQLLASVLMEALVIAVVASLIGLAVGVFVARGLKGMLEAFGVDVPAGGLVFTARTAVISVLAGIFITLVAAQSPARKAGKVSPVEAMHATTIGSTGYGSKERVIVGGVVLSAGVAALLFGLFSSPSNALGIVGAGVLLVFFGVSALGRTVSLPMSRVLGAPLPRIKGTTGILARENAMRNPKRTASSASALMIGVGLVGFITILASSTKASVNAAIDRDFMGDFVIDSGTPGLWGGLDPGLANRLNEVPEVDAAAGLRIGSAQIEGDVKMVAGLDPKTAFEVIDVGPVSGSTADLGRDQIAVLDDVAKDKGFKVGDVVTARFKDSGEKRLQVALIFSENRLAGVDYILGLAAYEANFGINFDSQVFVKKAAGVSPGQGLVAVERVAAAYPGAEVFDQTGYKKDRGEMVNQMLGLVYAMLALAIVIALLGIGNTLALAIFERTRELGLLRAVGMTRGQLRSTIRWESVIIALQGTALGLVIGLFFGWALVRALSDQGIDQFAVPGASLFVVVILAALAGVVAAIRPARRAANLNVLQAIASE